MQIIIGYIHLTLLTTAVLAGNEENRCFHLIISINIHSMATKQENKMCSMSTKKVLVFCFISYMINIHTKNAGLGTVICRNRRRSI